MKVLIADGEKSVRQWFLFCLERSSIDYDIIYEAVNRGKVLELTKYVCPDIAVVDVRMLSVNGFELFKKIKQKSPNTEFIVMASRTDLVLAKQAVEIGCFDYLLKDEVQDGDVIDLLGRLLAKRKEQDIFKNIVEERVQSKRDALLKDMLDGKFSDNAAALSKLKMLGVNLSERFLFAIAVRIRNKDNTKVHNMVELLKLIDPDIVDNPCWFSCGGNKFILVGNFRGVPSHLLQMNNLHRLVTYITRNIDCSIGISLLHHTLYELWDACREALSALGNDFFGTRVNIFAPTDAGLEKDRQFYAHELQDLLTSVIEDNNISHYTNRIEQIIENLAKSYINDTKKLFRVCIEILDSVFAQYKFCQNITDVQKPDLKDQIKYNRNLKQLKEWMINVISEYV